MPILPMPLAGAAPITFRGFAGPQKKLQPARGVEKIGNALHGCRHLGIGFACRPPSGMGSVQTFSGRHINVSLDGTIEMSADDAQYLIRTGWTKLAEWTRDEAV